MKRILLFIFLLIPVYAHCGFVTGVVVGNAMSSSSLQQSSGGRVGSNSYLVACYIRNYSQCSINTEVVSPSEVCTGKYIYDGLIVVDSRNMFVVCTLRTTDTDKESKK